MAMSVQSGREWGFQGQAATALRRRTSTADQRIAKLKRLKEAVERHAPALYEASFKDYRKPSLEVDITEILPIVETRSKSYSIKEVYFNTLAPELAAERLRQLDTKS